MKRLCPIGRIYFFFKLPLKEPLFNESSMFTLKMQEKDLFKGELLACQLVGYGEMLGGKDGKIPQPLLWCKKTPECYTHVFIAL